MEKQERIKDVGKYIEKYYIPGNDDIDVNDEQIKGFFGGISNCLKRKNNVRDEQSQEKSTSQSAAEIPEEKKKPEFDISTAQKMMITRSMSEVMVGNRKIDDLMSQMDETFSERLLRMIRERDITEAEAYKKAYVDRRHFSKIKKDRDYMPNKKTVLAFSIALELSLDETKDLLRSAGFALSRSSKFDIIIQ